MTKDLIGASVIFDLDGTLVDTAEDLAASMNCALGRAGLPPAPAEAVRGLVGRGARRMLMRGYELAAGRAASESELNAGLAVFLEHYEANIAVHSRPFEGAVEVIEGLRKRGAAIAICTNKCEALSRRLIKALQIDRLFDAIVGADTATALKPDPAPVRLCLERTGAMRGVFVGDSDTDIKAAGAAGLPCLIAAFGYGPLTQAGDATAIFENYADAGELIESAFRA